MLPAARASGKDGLRRTITFGPEPAPEKVAGVMATLVREGAIKIVEGAVEYRELRVERQV